MPQMYPMNWFMFSMFLIFLMSMAPQSEIFTPKMNNNKILSLKNIKWMW